MCFSAINYLPQCQLSTFYFSLPSSSTRHGNRGKHGSEVQTGSYRFGSEPVTFTGQVMLPRQRLGSIAK